jgi:hypothetical protein
LLLTLIIFFVRTDLCGHKRREVTGNGEELSKVSAFHEVIWVMNSRRMKWTRHVGRMRGRKAPMLLVGIPVGKRPL